MSEHEVKAALDELLTSVDLDAADLEEEVAIAERAHTW